MPISSYIIGQPFPSLLPRGDFAHFNYNGGWELIIGFTTPTDPEIQAYRNDPIQFKLYTEPDGLILVFKVGTMPWSDAPYYYWRDPTNIVPIIADEHYTIRIFLVDTVTGILKAMRLCTISPIFSKELAMSVEMQKNQKKSLDGHIAMCNRVQSRYTPTDLADLDLPSCLSGE